MHHTFDRLMIAIPVHKLSGSHLVGTSLRLMSVTTSNCKQSKRPVCAGFMCDAVTNTWYVHADKIRLLHCQLFAEQLQQAAVALEKGRLEDVFLAAKWAPTPKGISAWLEATAS